MYINEGEPYTNKKKYAFCNSGGRFDFEVESRLISSENSYNSSIKFDVYIIKNFL